MSSGRAQDGSSHLGTLQGAAANGLPAFSAMRDRCPIGPLHPRKLTVAFVASVGQRLASWLLCLTSLVWLLNIEPIAAEGPSDPAGRTPPAKADPAAAPPAPDAPLDGRDGRTLALDQFRPVASLKNASHQPARAKFPVVDVHTHPKIRLHHDDGKLAEFVRVMDAHQVAVCVSLDGGLGDAFAEHLAYLRPYADRFVVFANLDFQGQGKPDDPATWDCQRPDFARRTAAALAQAKLQGACGLKLFKEFGLGFRNADGSFIAIDDPRWDEIWKACGELGLPVIVHTADPSAFFRPIDEQNERWEELHRHPEWSFFGPQWPTRESLHAARNRVIARHPKTTFIAAHLGNDGEDLTQLAGWLDEYPNLVVELASRIAELGRQPYAARRFLIQYSDRVMFGTDGPRAAERLAPHWRFLETWDEYFPYAENPFPPQGFWNIYGLGLPDDVLRRIYHENAARIIPGVNEKLTAWRKGRNP